MTEFHWILFLNVALTSLTASMLNYCFTKPDNGHNIKGIIPVATSFIVFLAFIIGHISTISSNSTTKIVGSHSFFCAVLSLIVGYGVFYICKSVRDWTVKQPPYLKIGRFKLPRDNRMLLIISVWTLTFLITSYLAAANYLGLVIVSTNFYQSWTVDVIFFTFMGFAVVAATLKLPQDEEFSARVRMLFAAGTAEKNWNQDALLFVEDELKKLGFVVSYLQRDIYVTNYDAKLKTYRIEMVVKTTLKNLFGDVKATDGMGIGYTPVDFADCKSNLPGKQVGAITSIFEKVLDGNDKGKERLENAIEIDYGNEPLELTFSVSDYKTEITMQLWTWCKVDEEMTYAPSRYNYETITTITNRIQDGINNLRFISPICNDTNSVALKYGDRATLDTIRNVNPGDIKLYMTWLEPVSTKDLNKDELIRPEPKKKP